MQAINTLAKLVGRNHLASNLAERSIAGRTTTLLREWLKPSSHVDHAGSRYLAITLTGEEIVEIVHKNHQPDFANRERIGALHESLCYFTIC
jgi:hypothetical protein